VKKGFTLVELLVVIAIIGIIVVAVVVALNPAKRISDAQDAALRAQVSSIGFGMNLCMSHVIVATGTQNGYAGCNTSALLTAAATPGGPWLKTTPPATAAYMASTAGGALNGCVYISGSVAGVTTYYIFQSTSGAVTTQASVPVAANCL
jgi:prepilin-type N-terminal cleavage/methylation domain-containing protein